MKYWKLNLAMLWLSQLLIMAGFDAMIPFIPLFIKDGLGVSDPAALMMYVSMFNFWGSMGYAIFNPIWGFLADKFGVKPMLLRGTFVTAFLFPMMAYVKSPWMLIFLRFVSSSCAGTTAASQMMIARTTPDEHQGFAQGLLSTAIWGGAMLGNMVGGLIIHYYSYTCAFWICGIMYFLAGISVLFTKDMPRKAVVSVSAADSVKPKRRFSLLPDFSRAIWIVLLLFLVMGAVRNIEKPFIALRIEELTSKDTAALWTGIISAIVCVGAIISGAVGGHLADRFHPKKLAIPIMLFSGICLFMQGVGSKPCTFAIFRVLLFLVAGAMQPMLQKVLSGVTPQDKRGSSFGFASCLGQIGVMISALIGGYFAAKFGVDGVFMVGGVLMFIALPIYLKGMDECLKGKTLKYSR